jgi:hypothetical protein
MCVSTKARSDASGLLEFIYIRLGGKIVRGICGLFRR